MTEYDEKYIINKRVLGIQKTDNGFKVWTSGCAIGDTDTIEGARARIRNYALVNAQRERDQFQALATAAATVVNALDNRGFLPEKFREGPAYVESTQPEYVHDGSTLPPVGLRGDALIEVSGDEGGWFGPRRVCDLEWSKNIDNPIRKWRYAEKEQPCPTPSK
jgi:hypothetical protein